MRARLGLLGPLVVIVGVAAAAVGIWFMLHVRPAPGKFIDGVALDDDSFIAVREQSGTDRNFIEVTRQNKLLWQAMIPHYAGRVGAPAIGISKTAMTVRIARRGRSEVFGLSLTDSRKLGALLLGKDRPVSATSHCGEVITVTDDERAFELISSPDDNAIASIDVTSGMAGWQADLGKSPIVDAGVADGVVWVKQLDMIRAFRAVDGSKTEVPAAAQQADRQSTTRRLAPGITYETRLRRLVFETTPGQPTFRYWPADAAEPWPYHIGNTTILVIRPSGITRLPLAPDMPLPATA